MTKIWRAYRLRCELKITYKWIRHYQVDYSNVGERKLSFSLFPFLQFFFLGSEIPFVLVHLSFATLLNHLASETHRYDYP